MFAVKCVDSLCGIFGYLGVAVSNYCSVCGAVTWTDAANMKIRSHPGHLELHLFSTGLCRQVSAVTPDGAWANPCNCLQGLYG